MNDIINFIYANKKQSKCVKTGDIITHTEADISTIRHIVLNCMDKTGYSCKFDQQAIANALGYSRTYICDVIKRLEQAGFIYKTQRYRDAKSINKYDNGKKIIPCIKSLRTTLGYHLAPNLRNRIFEAISNKVNQLKPANLINRVRSIFFSKTKIVRNFFSGKREIEYITPREAIERKKQLLEKEVQEFREQRVQGFEQTNQEFKSDSLKSVFNGLFEVMQVKKQQIGTT